MWEVMELEIEGSVIMYLSLFLFLFAVTLLFKDHPSIGHKVCLVLNVVDKASSRVDIYIFRIQSPFLLS